MTAPTVTAALPVVWAEALALSAVQPSDHLPRRQLIQAARGVLQRHPDDVSVAAAAAYECGQHPEEFTARMRWALNAFGSPALPPSPPAR